jgi:hypothetical protein
MPRWLGQQLSLRQVVLQIMPAFGLTQFDLIGDVL